MAIVVKRSKDKIRDKRGVIERILDDEAFSFHGVLRITSKKGSIRSNHYHKQDSHYLYLEKGKCEYSEKKANNPSAKIERIILRPGDVVLSKPGIIHAVKFLEDSILWAFTTEKRNKKAYEQDTVRVAIVE